MDTVIRMPALSTFTTGCQFAHRKNHGKLDGFGAFCYYQHHPHRHHHPYGGHGFGGSGCGGGLEASPCRPPSIYGSMEEHTNRKRIGSSSIESNTFAALNLQHGLVKESTFQIVMNQSSVSGIQQNLFNDKAGSAGMPMSLRMLKRKSQKRSRDQNAGLSAVGEPACGSFKKAFSSMVSMIRSMQSYTLQLWQPVLYRPDLEAILAAVHTDVHCSSLWLFEKIFACTPKLMLSVMLLLANYMVHSMGNYMAPELSQLSPSASKVASAVLGHGERQVLDKELVAIDVDQCEAPSPSSKVGNDHASCSFSVCSETDSGAGGSRSSIVSVSGEYEDPQYFKSPLSSGSAFTLETRSVGDNLHNKYSVQNDEGRGAKQSTSTSLSLSGETMKDLVAPVEAKLAADSYPCYDRTELTYMHAIQDDANNAMLLANYAQFLFLVRHDHDRAERMFSLAISVDAGDGDIMGRYASFLWLAQNDKTAAEKAYRRVIDIDPSNPYFAALYANFLWCLEGSG